MNLVLTYPETLTASHVTGTPGAADDVPFSIEPDARQIYDTITLKDYNESGSLVEILRALEVKNITCTRLVIENSKFGGNSNCDALIKFIGHFNDQLKVIEITDVDPCISDSDKARLRQFARNHTITTPGSEFPLVHISRDDSYIGEITITDFNYENTTFRYTKNPFSWFHSDFKISAPTPASKNLLNFFSCYHQQRSDVTCGPACIRMIMNYFAAVFFRRELSSSAENPIIPWLKKDESCWAKLFKTDEEGSDNQIMADTLSDLDFPLIHQCELPPLAEDPPQIEGELAATLLYRLEQLQYILDRGIPVVVNYMLKHGTDAAEGHFSVLTAMNDGYVLLADPATHYDGEVKHIKMSIADFIASWHSETTRTPGIYLALFPNMDIKIEVERKLNSGSALRLSPSS